MDRIEGVDGDSPEEARRRLSRRLVAASVLIVVLLGALAVFDRLSQMEDDEAPPPRSASKGPGPSVRTEPVERVGTPPPSPIQPSVAEAPKVEPPPKPEIAAQPAVEPTPVAAAPVPVATVPPAPGTVPAMKAGPAQAATMPALPAVPVAPQVPEGSSGGEIRPAPAEPAANPASGGTVSPIPARPVLPQPRRGYVLQAGVFTSTERAEELRARLLMAGVPATIESRVQVGPFASAQEAAAAREKIKALGIESIVIPPARPRAAGR
jgi:cell division protein FtsN